MYTTNPGPLRAQQSSAQSQIVVKLKRTREVRGVLRAAAAEGRMPSVRGALDRLLSGRNVLGIDPIFEDVFERGLQGFRRMARAAVRETDSRLAGLNVVSLPSRGHAMDACAKVLKDPLVEFAYVIPEKYPLARRRAGPDPLANRQWGIAAVELFAAEADPGFPDASNVVVAVIDSGIDSRHPDLKGVVSEELNFTPSRQLKDIGGHGTHVAGTIAALTNNQRGVRGIVSSPNIMSLKALEPYDGPGYYRALRHATDNGAHVINLSLGGGKDPTEEILIKRAIRQGVTVVAAMGNDKLRGNPTSYPAAIAGVIAVGASTETDGIADFSQTGRHIDVVAPGVNILSTVPTYPSRLANGTGYEAWPGTSMATPHVAAAIALMRAKNPGASNAKLRRALVRSADKVPGQTRFSSTFGHGRLNIRKALERI